MAGVREQLLSYYERELTYIRQMGAEFGAKYPKLAGRLLLEPDRCEDPHVERLLEGFALLAARVHLKIDDDFPEISTALLNTLYPHYIRPVPSMSIVQFELDSKQAKLTTSMKIPKGSVLRSVRINGNDCKFRTAYDVNVQPIEIKECSWISAESLTSLAAFLDADQLRKSPPFAALRLKMVCLQDVRVSKLDLTSLILHLSGESSIVNALYELLVNDCVAIFARSLNPSANEQPVLLRKAGSMHSQSRRPPCLLRPIGFGEEEGILPYSGRSFLGYRLLQEYFVFPDKFFFLGLDGLEAVKQPHLDNGFELLFLIRRFEKPERHQMLELGVNAGSVRLNCTPIINLFTQTAEPIRCDQTKYEYPIVPDVRHRQSTEIFSVDAAIGHNSKRQRNTYYEPFYAFRHASALKPDTAFWHTSRRVSEVDESLPTEVFLSLVNISGETIGLDADSVTVHCTCTNGPIPSKLPIGNDSGDFQLDGFSAIRKIVGLRRPTPSLPPPLGKPILWKLISHLSLNYLSLVEDGKGALQEILSLYNFSDSAFLRNQISGIHALRSRRELALVASESGVASLVRGTRVELELDESQFAGGGVYLFCSVVERFLSLYASLNSFSQLSAKALQRKELLAQWAPRAGSSILV